MDYNLGTDFGMQTADPYQNALGDLSGAGSSSAAAGASGLGSGFGLGMTGLGFGLSAFGALEEGAGKASALNYNAQTQENNARAVLLSAKLNADKSSLVANRVLGQAKANYGASGVEGSSGSVLDVLASSAANAELDRQNILYGGQVKAVNADNQASLDRMGANNAMGGSYMAAFGDLLKGGATLAALL